MKRNVKAALLSALVFPGLGQIFKGRRIKGCMMMLLANLLLILAVALTVNGVLQMVATGIIPETPNAADAAIAVKHLFRENPGFKWLIGLFSLLWVYSVADSLFADRSDHP